MRAVDRVLIEALPKAPPAFLITGLDPAGDLGIEAAARYPAARVVWFHLDLFAAGRARSRGLDPARIVVEPDLPGPAAATPADAPGRPDLVALPLPRGAEALLARELIEEAHDALALGGRLLAATNGDPAWLKKVVREVFRAAEVTARGEGAVVHARRARPDAVLKDHSHVAHGTFFGRELRFRTRPGVFSYGHVDQGSKALLAVADFAGVRRILDVGCGVGVLGIAAAAAAPESSAVLVDANVRAVALARENAAINAIPRVIVIGSDDPGSLELEPFDCVLANPPYFADFTIAERFIAAAHRHLAPRGRLWLVAKAAAEHADLVGARFGNVHLARSSGYGVISAQR